MKNFNLKAVKETTKTIMLTALVAGVAGFVGGVQYETGNSDKLRAAFDKVTTQATAAPATAVNASASNASASK